jgi:predicted nucleic acid-binding protein
MIHLDTNYLIGLAVAGSPQAQRVDQWLAGGESLGASALAWTEFLNGPVQPQEISLVESIIESRVVPFDKATAVLAAGLFNQTGRRRGSRFDCLIAATAILAQAEFATENDSDFAPFVSQGLKLAT